MKYRVQKPGSKVIYITGTDTDAGKTVFTALFIHYLRSHGISAMALKPFCSGGRQDAILLRKVQEKAYSLDEINPWHFKKPLAPAIAAALEHQKITLDDVQKHILESKKKAEYLLIEGAGGLLAPLGENFTLLDVIRKTGGRVIIVAPNKLGVINHVCLTVTCLHYSGIKEVAIVMNEVGKSDISTQTNRVALTKQLPQVPVFSQPRCPISDDFWGGLKKDSKYFDKTLAQYLRDL
jgi:dethiobiotin synthetase